MLYLRHCLSLLGDQLVKNLTIEEDDFDNVPLLQGPGGKAKVRKVFGELYQLVARLNEEVVS